MRYRECSVAKCDQATYSERYEFHSGVDYRVDNRAGNGMIAP